MSKEQHQKSALALLLFFLGIIIHSYFDNKAKLGLEEAPASTEEKKFIWIEGGKARIRNRLKDGASAKFRDVFFSSTMAPTVCGEVNAKNSFGAYTGYIHFITANNDTLTVLESDMSKKDFSETWQRMCVR